MQDNATPDPHDWCNISKCKIKPKTHLKTNFKQFSVCILERNTWMCKARPIMWSRLSWLRVMVNSWRVWRRRGSLTAGSPAGVSGSTWGCGYWRGCREGRGGNSAGEAGLSSTAGFYLTRRSGQRRSAHRRLKLNSSLNKALRNLWSWYPTVIGAHVYTQSLVQ